MTEKELIAIAKDEIKQWVGLPNGLPQAILWAFIHRVTTGRTIEEDFFTGGVAPQGGEK